MRIFLTFCIFLSSFSLFAQSNLLPEGSQSAMEAERLSVRYPSASPYHFALQPLRRADMALLALQIGNTSTSKADNRGLAYLVSDNFAWLPAPLLGETTPGEAPLKKIYTDSTSGFYSLEPTAQGKIASAPTSRIGIGENAKPLFGFLYRHKAAMYDLDLEGFKLVVNPLFRFSYARDRKESEAFFMNQRGIQLQGQIDHRVYFDVNILESQVRFPTFINRRIIRDDALPGAGSFTPYKSTLFNVKNGYDFLLSQGLVGAQLTKHIGFQAGHGKNFIGDGYRSLLLSDFGNNYFFLRFNTRVWKLHYQNLFTKLKSSSVRSNRPGNLLPSKYMSAHYLSAKLRPNLQIGVYESIVYGRSSLELEYFNPVILYRTVEEQLGSPDNTLIGFNGRWDIAGRVSLYGQLMLDEFNFRKLRANYGWWGNKYGLQAGIKYFDVLGVPGLFAQVEANRVTPFTYSHADSIRNYAHFRQSLAHPLGSNFTEVISVLRYQPSGRWLLEARLNLVDAGLDTDSLNYGSNPLVSYTTRWNDTGNKQGQGIPVTITTGIFEVSYAVYHNVWADLQLLYRQQNSPEKNQRYSNLYTGLGIRVNLSKWRNDF